MVRQAAVLAGGKGTRLASRLNGAPKPLVDVLGTPLLERQILQLAMAGIERILILVNHKAELIEAYCASRQNWGLEITFVDDGEPRGTAGAMYDARSRLDAEFLVIYGDTLFDVDLGRFIAFHNEVPEALASLFLHPNDHPQDSDLVEMDDDGLIRAFHSYPHPPTAWLPNMVNAALYAMRRDALETGAMADFKHGVVDFAKDLFPRLVASGACLRGYASPEYIKDIGTPDRLDRACRDLASGKVERASLRNRQTAVFLDRDGTLNSPNGHIASPDQLNVFDFAPEAVRRLNASGRRVILTTNQPVIARGDCTVEDLAEIHAKLETILGREGAFLERIYYCPHHPDSGFDGERPELKIVCDCRKPLPGLLMRAAMDLNLDLGKSWMIGDSAADIDAARACGVTSVLVKTGDATDKTVLEARVDFTFQTVLDAAVFITDSLPKVTELAQPLVEKLTPGADLFVGGQSRSGKSTFARTLAWVLRQAGRRAMIVGLDGWLLPDDERTPGLLGRYDLPAMIAWYRAAARRSLGSVQLDPPPLFSQRDRTRLATGGATTLSPETIVIWEGVPALALAEQLNALDNLACLTTDEEARRARVIAEYIGRGQTVADAEDVYVSRLNDEILPIMAGLPKSPILLTLDKILSGGRP